MYESILYIDKTLKDNNIYPGTNEPVKIGTKEPVKKAPAKVPFVILL